MACMIPSTTRSEHDRAVRYPREIAAAVTLRAACAALTDGPADEPLAPPAAIAVLTSCGALATRFAILEHLADPDDPDPRTAVPFDAFSDRLPPALTGSGPVPDRRRRDRGGGGTTDDGVRCRGRRFACRGHAATPRFASTRSVWSTASFQARSGSLPVDSTLVISVAKAPMKRSRFEM